MLEKMYFDIIITRTGIMVPLLSLGASQARTTVFMVTDVLCRFVTGPAKNKVTIV